MTSRISQWTLDVQDVHLMARFWSTALGFRIEEARRVDVGQRDDDPFVVLADPEGNEFCLLRRSP